MNPQKPATFDKVAYDRAYARTHFYSYRAQLPIDRKDTYHTLAKKCGDRSLNALIIRLLDEEASRRL